MFANKGYHPRLTLNLDNPGVSSAEVNAYVSDLSDLHEYLKDRIFQVLQEHVYYADRGRREVPDWKKGDRVYLNMENIRTWRPAKKFENKWVGPFDILEQVGSHAYRLDLLGDLKQIHNVFHVNRLKPYYPNPFK